MSAQLRRLAPALLRRGYAKTSTGIVGLPVVPNSREELMTLSNKILKAVAALPETAHYRRNVEAVYSARLAACKAHSEPEAIEAALGQGQMEELIRMAQDEARLIPKMAGAFAMLRRVRSQRAWLRQQRLLQLVCHGAPRRASLFAPPLRLNSPWRAERVRYGYSAQSLGLTPSAACPLSPQSGSPGRCRRDTPFPSRWRTRPLSRPRQTTRRLQCVRRRLVARQPCAGSAPRQLRAAARPQSRAAMARR